MLNIHITTNTHEFILARIEH